jgi:hypothetical protein
MRTRTLGTTAKTVCVAAAIALAAAISGCGLAPSGPQTSSGVSTSLVAPAPETVPSATDGRSSATGQSSSGFAGAPAADAAKGGTGNTVTAAPIQKLVVVNKTLRIETTDVDTSIAKIRTLVARDGADITNLQVSNAVDQPVYPLASGSPALDQQSVPQVPLQAFVTVRVPSSTYAAFLADAEKLGRVLFQSETSDDVTQQHVDMQARLDNMKAEQTRLRQLFSKANKVSDMLAIEQELTRVQGDIESMQAQIAYLERQAAMATVTIELTEPTPIVSPSGTDWGVRAALTNAVRAFVDTLNVLIVMLGPVLALIVFVGLPVLLIVWLIRRGVRRRKASKAAPAPASASGPEATA